MRNKLVKLFFFAVLWLLAIVIHDYVSNGFVDGNALLDKVLIGLFVRCIAEILWTLLK